MQQTRLLQARDEKQREWCKRRETTGVAQEDLRRWGELVFKLARDRDRESKDITQTSAMKRSDGTLVTGVKQVLGVWVEYFKKLLNPVEECEIELPHSVRRERTGGEITEEGAEKAVKNNKKWEGRRNGRSKRTSGNQGI